jgi:hypothetical protein
MYRNWDYEMSYEDLLTENYELKRKLEESERKYNEFLDKMVNSTTSVTNEWMKVLLSGDLKLK